MQVQTSFLTIPHIAFHPNLEDIYENDNDFVHTGKQILNAQTGILEIPLPVSYHT